jgi:hypothetical protein
VAIERRSLLKRSTLHNRNQKCLLDPFVTSHQSYIKKGDLKPPFPSKLTNLISSLLQRPTSAIR